MYGKNQFCKHLCALLVLLLTFNIANCYMMMEKPHPDAGPDECLSNVYKTLVLRVGESADLPGVCMKATCMENHSISYAGCGSVFLPANCKFLEPDLTLPYPKCCQDKYICDD